MSNNMLDDRYMCFTLGKDRFAIPLLQVKEVIGNMETTPIPQSPPYLKGILNLRGQVLSVVDLRVKMKSAKPEIQSETPTMILDFGSLQMGVIVDSVDSVVTFGKEVISASPIQDTSVKMDFIIGVAKPEGQSMVVILDLTKVLNIQEIKSMQPKEQKAA